VTAARPRIAIIVGPTASGKSDLALALARTRSGEIVSADSMQVYRGLDAATSKPGAVERAEIPHHLVDAADPGNDWSMGDFVRSAETAIAAILARGRLPIVVGGTGLYIRALLRGPFDAPGRDEALRARLRRVAERRGPQRLHRWLSRVDPATAARLGPRDAQRLVRALEVWLLTGRRLSERVSEAGFAGDRYDAVKIGISLPVEELDRRIAKRVDRFLAAGLIDEARRLLAAGVPETANAFKALGYREALAVLRGALPPEQAAAAIALATRRYAKRQRTWFRHEPGIVWLDGTLPEDRLLEAALRLL